MTVSEADSIPEPEQGMGFLVMDALCLLLNGNNSNASWYQLPVFNCVTIFAAIMDYTDVTLSLCITTASAPPRHVSGSASDWCALRKGLFKYIDTIHRGVSGMSS